MKNKITYHFTSGAANPLLSDDNDRRFAAINLTKTLLTAEEIQALIDQHTSQIAPVDDLVRAVEQAVLNHPNVHIKTPCMHSYHHFGEQKTRRCNNCGEQKK